MAPLRIAHLSDTHLGYRALTKTDERSGRNQRSVDIEHAFAWAIDDLLRRDIDLVIHSGDLFHHPRPAFPAIAAAVRQFRKLEQAGIPTLVIGGNHDTPRLRTSGSVFSLLGAALPEITFFGGYEEGRTHFPELDLEVAAVPHGRLANPDKPVMLPSPGMRNILVTHGFVPNLNVPYHLHEPGEEEIAAHMLDPEYDYVALGHYHQYIGVEANVYYSGSTERIGWGDAQTQPGYVIAELTNQGALPAIEHIPTPARPMHRYEIPERITLDGDSVRIAEHVLHWLEELSSPEGMARVVLAGVPRPVRRHAESLILQDVGNLVWSVEVTGKADFFAGVPERGPDIPSIDLLDQFATFVAEGQETGRYDPVFAVSFALAGRAALEQAQAAIDAQITTEDAQ